MSDDNAVCGICGNTWGCECEQTLFHDDDRRCKACGTTRRSLCKHDADLEHGFVNRTRKRPRSCLNNT